MGRHTLYGVCINGWLIYFLQFNVRMEFAALPYKVNSRIDHNGPHQVYKEARLISYV